MAKKSTTPATTSNNDKAAKKSTTPTKADGVKKGKKGMGTRAKDAKTNFRQEARLGLSFPIGRIDRRLKQMRLAERTGRSGAIFMAAVLEYLCSELLEVAGLEAQRKNRLRIKPEDI